MRTNGTMIKVYEPEPESFEGNTLKFRSAISVIERGAAIRYLVLSGPAPKWKLTGITDQIIINTLNITDHQDSCDRRIRINIDYIDDALETQFPAAAGPISLDEILTSLDQNQQETKLSQNISNKPPKVMFVTQPSMLVLIDGDTQTATQ